MANYSAEQQIEIRDRIQRCSRKLEPREINPGRNNRTVAPEDAPFVPPLNHFQKMQLITCFGNVAVQVRLNDQVRAYLHL